MRGEKQKERRTFDEQFVVPFERLDQPWMWMCASGVFEVFPAGSNYLFLAAFFAPPFFAAFLAPPFFAAFFPPFLVAIACLLLFSDLVFLHPKETTRYCV